MNRVLRPGGQFCVMVYHRGSVNFHYGIKLLRRLALILVVVAQPLATRFARNRGEDAQTLAGHRANLRKLRARYLIGNTWLSANTDGPSNTYSRVYSSRELGEALRAAGLTADKMEVRYLNARVNPPLQLLPDAVASRLAKRYGWHLYAIGHKN
jgi:hypothetical protein